MVNGRPCGRLSPRARVRKRSEFQRVQECGSRVFTPAFVLLLARSPAPGPARLGITASRRVGGAVDRNRAKRLVREAFRATRELWPNDVDVVVIAKRGVPRLGLDDVVRQWRQAESRIRRQCDRLMADARDAEPDARTLLAKKSC